MYTFSFIYLYIYICTYLHTQKHVYTPGIPECVPKRGYASCLTFVYTPAPWDEYEPSQDYATVDEFASAVQAKGVRLPYFCICYRHIYIYIYIYQCVRV